MQKIYILFYILIAIITRPITSKPALICIAGPSCSGKSTISKQLNTKLNSYTLLEYDSIEDSVGRDIACEQVFKILVTRAAERVDHNQSVIIDTNTLFLDQMVSLADKANIIYVYVYAPLEILLGRDLQRTTHLNRDEIRAQRARDFVIHNFYSFYPDGIPVDGQYTINSYTLNAVDAVEQLNKYIDSLLIGNNR